MLKFLSKYIFWMLAAISVGGSFWALLENNFMALLAFFLLFVVTMVAGVYYANVEFTKELLTEYDNVVRSQRNRKGFKVIKGGKKK